MLSTNHKRARIDQETFQCRQCEMATARDGPEVRYPGASTHWLELIPRQTCHHKKSGA
jgi:hypothetical protein